MNTRNRVVNSGLGASPASRPTRDPQDPSGRQGELSPVEDQREGLEAAPKGPSRESVVHAGQRRTSAYTLIAPNINRRNEIQRIAEQELANLEKWKEQNRAKPVHLVPRRLGGSQSETEVRQKQQLQLMQSKYKQKLKREESVRIKKEAEEAELQKMKAIQREKSNKLEEKKRLQENLRREAFREHQQYKTAEFLSKLNTESPDRSACQSAVCGPQSSTWARSWAYRDSLKAEENRKLQKMKDEQHQKSELLELKRQQQEQERAKIHQTEHRRVNNAFLDRLQGKSQPGGLEQSGGCWNMNSGNSWGSLLVFSRHLRVYEKILTPIWPSSTDLEKPHEMLFLNVILFSLTVFTLISTAHTLDRAVRSDWLLLVLIYACLEELIPELIFNLYCQGNATLFF
ncbi:epithelial-stromal interaction protein 1 isoform X1 [Homo sapiens]|uniref:epithelial-stromal interaction protein 1 isoform X1 n=1 Tax=Homo sapiens TaxID=9606 RepID=UPI0000EE4587|nr:epithelial-stromal interaction protein 1 isoform X1 [Homo sapiens]XP_054231168.1 epithelial-stromal interaction protein 1 isoform X1 [Homo sapiens]EAX08684.1 epithelial stromal interaction 1 (breast), isoform CRA_a [Homo sapiens]|eukprot:XP_005266653.1 epithelial-stromal interaction protein 1 isoform X1 [Homo sapiens]